MADTQESEVQKSKMKILTGFLLLVLLKKRSVLRPPPSF